MPTLRDFTLLDPRAMLDTDFYDNLRAGKPRHKLIDRFIIPPYEGRGFIVKRGQSFRIIEEEGVQIADVSFWNANNPRSSTVWPEPGLSKDGWSNPICESGLAFPGSGLWSRASRIPWSPILLTATSITTGSGLTVRPSGLRCASLSPG